MHSEHGNSSALSSYHLHRSHGFVPASNRSCCFVMLFQPCFDVSLHEKSAVPALSIRSLRVGAQNGSFFWLSSGAYQAACFDLTHWSFRGCSLFRKSSWYWWFRPRLSSSAFTFCWLLFHDCFYSLLSFSTYTIPAGSLSPSSCSPMSPRSSLLIATMSLLFSGEIPASIAASI